LRTPGLALLIHAPTLDDWRARPPRPAPQQLGKKVWAPRGGTPSPPPVPPPIGGFKELPAYPAGIAVGRDVRNIAVGRPLDCKQRLVASVNILAEFQVASVVYESGLVGQVDRDEVRKRDTDLVLSKHSPNAVLAVAFAWAHHRQQHFRIFHGILDPHAAVAF